jgi:hypothetical protein
MWIVIRSRNRRSSPAAAGRGKHFCAISVRVSQSSTFSDDLRELYATTNTWYSLYFNLKLDWTLSEKYWHLGQRILYEICLLLKKKCWHVETWVPYFSHQIADVCVTLQDLMRTERKISSLINSEPCEWLTSECGLNELYTSLLDPAMHCPLCCSYRLNGAEVYGDFFPTDMARYDSLIFINS